MTEIVLDELVEALPRGQNLEILHARPNYGIGGSDVAAVLGISPWETPLQFWTRLQSGECTDSTWPMTIGTALEQTILDWWSQHQGVHLHRVPRLRDKEHPWRIASLDAVDIDQQAVVEVKWSSFPLKELPPHYLVQIWWYMAITGLPRAYCLWASPRHEPTAVQVSATQADLESLLTTVDRWWQTYVVGNVEPKPTAPREMKLHLLQQSDGEIYADETLEQLGDRAIQAQQAAKAAEAEYKAATKELLERMSALNANKCIGATWTASILQRNGSIRYSEVVKQLGVSSDVLEQYRSDPVPYLQLRSLSDE